MEKTMTVAEVHDSIDFAIRQLNNAKLRRGGSLRVELAGVAEYLQKLSVPALYVD